MATEALFMTPYTRQKIRLLVDVSQPDGIVSAIGTSPFIWRNNDAAIELGFFVGESMVDVSQWASLSLKIKPAGDITGAPLAAITASGLNANLTLEAWQAGSSQHISILLSKEQTSLALVGLESNFHLVISALTTDLPAHEITLGVATLVIKEDGRGGEAVNPTPQNQYYTRVESDARFAGVPYVDDHVNDTSNPHGTTAAQVGLHNVNDTADMDKPVSTAQAAAIAAAVALKADVSALAAKVDMLSFNAALALKANILNPSFTQSITVPISAFPDDPGIIFGATGIKFLRCDGADYIFGGGGRLQVGGSWVVTEDTINKTMIGLGSVNNTPDTAKPVSGPQQTALDTKASASTLTAHTALTTSAHGGIVSSSDSRLSDSRPASDVYAWAKASSKPTYTYSEVGAAPSSTVSFPGFGTSGAMACVGNDSRLSNARPASDVYSWAKAASKPSYTYSEVGAAPSSTVSFPGFGSSVSTACVGNDSRLSDARAASDVYAWAKASSKPTYTYSEVGAAPSDTVSFPGFGTTETTACAGNDPRLSDSRNPLPHNQPWSGILLRPNSLAGYGILDAASLNHTHSTSQISGFDTYTIPYALFGAISIAGEAGIGIVLADSANIRVGSTNASTENVTINGTTLHFKNGIYTGHT